MITADVNRNKHLGNVRAGPIPVQPCYASTTTLVIDLVGAVPGPVPGTNALVHESFCETEVLGSPGDSYVCH